MDSRHETREQELLNELIEGINIYILDNLDEIIIRDKLLNDMKIISRCIYAYANMPVNVDDFISRKNLLSVDVVHLPKLAEEDLTQGRRKQSLADTLARIESVICVSPCEDYFHRQFKVEIQRLINKHAEVWQI